MSWNPLNQHFEIDGTGVYKRFSNNQFIQIFYWFKYPKTKPVSSIIIKLRAQHLY